MRQIEITKDIKRKYLVIPNKVIEESIENGFIEKLTNIDRNISDTNIYYNIKDKGLTFIKLAEGLKSENGIYIVTDSILINEEKTFLIISPQSKYRVLDFKIDSNSEIYTELDEEHYINKFDTEKINLKNFIYYMVTNQVINDSDNREIVRKFKPYDFRYGLMVLQNKEISEWKAFKKKIIDFILSVIEGKGNQIKNTRQLETLVNNLKYIERYNLKGCDV